MKRWKIWAISGIVLFAFVGTLFATSAVWKLNVKPGLTVGDIVYADRKDRLTNLNAGSSGEVLQAAGASTAPSYVAKNTYRQATIHNFATTVGSWQVSADELLCLMLASTNATGVNTVQVTATTGKILVYRNGSGYASTVHSSSGTGISVATGTAVMLIYDGILGDWIKLATMVTPGG